MPQNSWNLRAVVKGKWKLWTIININNFKNTWLRLNLLLAENIHFLPDLSYVILSLACFFWSSCFLNFRFTWPWVLFLCWWSSFLHWTKSKTRPNSFWRQNSKSLQFTYFPDKFKLICLYFCGTGSLLRLRLFWQSFFNGYVGMSFGFYFQSV